MVQIQQPGCRRKKGRKEKKGREKGKEEGKEKREKGREGGNPLLAVFFFYFLVLFEIIF